MPMHLEQLKVCCPDILCSQEKSDIYAKANPADVRIVTVVGARPQFIKCAPLSKELRKEHEEILVHTGQHYDYQMSKVFFEELEIPKPDYNLEVGSGSHATQTGRILMAVEKVLIKTEPDLVLVFGDTNSTIAAALAAAKLGIGVGHVEAGLRSYDRTMPEEINRVLTDHISSLLFAPTRVAVRNLRSEGIVAGVHNVGDVMVDMLESARAVARSKSKVLDRLQLRPRTYMAMTMHRASNTDDLKKLKSILKALGRSGEDIVFPMHPRTKKALTESGLMAKVPSNLRAIEPLGYVDMLRLMSEAKGIITDSGGIQKEAFLLGVRCITLRENTEWPETLVDGRNVLVGADESRILDAMSFPVIKGRSRAMPFGRPGASARISRILRVLPA